MGLFDRFKKTSNEIELVSPMTGEIVDVTEVDDPVFSQKMVGDGVAIKPSCGVVVAPCDGEIQLLFPTNHALGIVVDGVELLLHLGMDTVELKGEGFTAFVEQGDHVVAGQKLIEMDIEKIEDKGYSTVSPFIITSPDAIQNITKNLGTVEAGKQVVMSVTKK